MQNIVNPCANNCFEESVYNFIPLENFLRVENFFKLITEDTNMGHRVALMIASFCAVFVIAEKVNNYGAKRALVLYKKNDPIEFFTPKEIQKEEKIKQDHGKKPYIYRDGDIYYCCPRSIDPGKKAVNETDTLDGCLVAESIKTVSRAYYCETPINAMVTFTDSCAVNQRSGRLYKIGYKHCYKNLYGQNTGKYTVGFLTVYNLCYDHENQQTLYVDYEINSLKLLRSEVIEEKEKEFITKPTTFGYEVENFEEDLKFMESAMKDFTWERENTTVPPFKHRAMLASRLHFPFVQLKRVLFHYSNIILVYNNIIQLFLETQEFITTISTIDELRIFAVPLYTRSDEEGYDNWEKYTPYAIGYLIFNKEETKGIAIILHNEDEEMDNSKLQCNAAIKCPENYQINIINQLDVKLKGLVYCCNVNDVMNKWTFHPLQKKSDFDILNI